MKTTEPYGLLVSDKVNVVPFIGQRLTKFRRHDTTAAKSGITDNTNLYLIHGYEFVCLTNFEVVWFQLLF